VDFAQTGGGAVFGLVPPDSDQVEAAVILLDGPNESNGVFCIASSPWRDKGLIAWANWLSLLKTRDLGRRWFDFNGANSPGRAADKHLYSAKTQLYFDCSFGLYQG
jgi:hypothetical protein